MAKQKPSQSCLTCFFREDGRCTFDGDCKVKAPLPHYQVCIPDPDGQNRVFRVWRDVPIQRYRRDSWEVTIRRIKRTSGVCVDEVTWEKIHSLTPKT